MRTTLNKLLITLFSMLLPILVSAQIIRVASYNIRFDNPRDTLDLWQDRHPYVAGIIKLYDIDIFGTQEGLLHQLDDLRGELPGFEFIGNGRDDGYQKGEFSAIFFNTEKFKLVESGTFWLSQITDRPNKGWDAALPRICTWGKFKIVSSGIEFYFFNTHFDHMGEKARMESTKLLIEKIREFAGPYPVIFTGDFNFDETHPNFQILKNSGILKDSYDLAKFRLAPGGTFTGFDIASKPEGRIDHIFISGNISVYKYAIITNTYNGRYPSDHFAVFAELQLN